MILLLTDEMQSTEHKCSDMSSVRACAKGKSPQSLEHGRYVTHFLVEISDVETFGNAHCSSVYVMHLSTLIIQPNFFMLFFISFHQNTKDYHRSTLLRLLVICTAENYARWEGRQKTHIGLGYKYI